MNEYEGHWLSTYTGKRIHYLNPTPDEIDIRDIAHALALTCRFGGQCKEFYSVAQHSIHVAELLPSKLRLAGLLHDGHEAYLHDVPRPIKQDIAGYKEIADELQLDIVGKYKIACLSSFYKAAVKKADDTMLATEARDLEMNTTDWSPLPPPLEEHIIPWTWQDAETSFLDYFKLWGGKDGIVYEG